MNRKMYFATKLTDVSTVDLEGLGAEREEFDPILGLRKYLWVRNIDAGALAAGDSVSWERELTGPTFAVTATTGSNPPNSTQNLNFAAATFTARALAGCWLRVHDDAGAAGGAPEGEVHRIKTNTDSLIVLADDDLLTTAIAAADTVAIIRPWYLRKSADAEVAAEYAGIVLAAIPVNSYGWVQTQGIAVQATVVAAGTAIADGTALKPGAGILVAAADNADNGEVVASAIGNGIQSDTVLRKMAVHLLGP